MRSQLAQQTSSESLFCSMDSVRAGQVCCLLLGMAFTSQGGLHIHLWQLQDNLGVEESFLPGFSSSPCFHSHSHYPSAPLCSPKLEPMEF